MDNMLVHNLKVEPYPYQKEGIRFGLDKRRLLIGDEPGLGKTLQSIGIVDTANAYPALVICPSSLKINWQREFEKFTNKKALVLDNATRTAWPYFLQMGMFHVAVVNYESLRKYFVWDINSSDRRSFRLKDVVFNDAIKVFRSVIIDESHRVKDPSAQQTIFTRGIVEGKDFRILLSGTPVVNRAEDLVSQLSIMGRLQEFGGRGKFLADYGENDNLEELSQQLYRRCMIRREKTKVLTQLPDKTRTDLYVEISNREEYELAAEDLAEYLRQYKECSDLEIRRKMRMEALVKFMTLRSLSAKGKVKQAIDFVRVFLFDRADAFRVDLDAGYVGDDPFAEICIREVILVDEDHIARFDVVFRVQYDRIRVLLGLVGHRRRLLGRGRFRFLRSGLFRFFRSRFFRGGFLSSGLLRIAVRDRRGQQCEEHQKAQKDRNQSFLHIDILRFCISMYVYTFPVYSITSLF